MPPHRGVRPGQPGKEEGGRRGSACTPWEEGLLALQGPKGQGDGRWGQSHVDHIRVSIFILRAQGDTEMF